MPAMGPVTAGLRARVAVPIETGLSAFRSLRLSELDVASDDPERACRHLFESAQRPGDIDFTPCVTRVAGSTSKPMVTKKEI